MGRYPLLFTILLASLVSLLAACGGSSAVPQDQQPPAQSFAPALPAPVQLRSTSAVATRLFLWGQGYDSAIPSHRAAQVAQRCVFTPDWTLPGATADGLSYAMYRFNTSDYTGAAQLHFTWSETDDYADAWVALADWPHNRWQWFQLDESDALAYETASHVNGAGELLAAVLLTGMAQWTLDSVYIEEPAETWNVFGGNPQRTRCAAVNGPQSATEKWHVVLPGYPTQYDPVIGSNGTIYVSGAGGYLFAITPDGTLDWTYELHDGFNVRASPAVGADGMIYVGTWDKILYAVNPDGTLKWSYETGDFIEAGVVFNETGQIYLGSDDGLLHVLNQDGGLAWSFPAGGMVYAAPTFSQDGHIYLANTDGLFYCLFPDGNEDWRYNAGLTIWGPAAVASDGTVYFGSRNENIYALNSDGSEKWVCPTGGWVWSSAAVCPDGTMVIGNRSAGFYAISQDGDLLWTHSGHSMACATIGADGTVYCTGNDGSSEPYLYALNPGDGSEKWHFAGCTGCPAIGPDGTLYVSGTTPEDEPCIYAIGE